MELKDLVKYYVPMRMEGSSPPNWEVVFGYDISKFKGYNVDEVRVALNLTQLWLSQGPRVLIHVELTHSAHSFVDFSIRRPSLCVCAEAGSDPLGHLWVTWGVFLCAGKPPLADIILSHPPGLSRCE